MNKDTCSNSQRPGGKQEQVGKRILISCHVLGGCVLIKGKRGGDTTTGIPKATQFERVGSIVKEGLREFKQTPRDWRGTEAAEVTRAKKNVWTDKERNWVVVVYKIRLRGRG